MPHTPPITPPRNESTNKVPPQINKKERSSRAVRPLSENLRAMNAEMSVWTIVSSTGEIAPNPTRGYLPPRAHYEEDPLESTANQTSRTTPASP